ncbi:MAG: YARHG domain-containing protein [Pseudomonadota bacterium]
MTRFLSVFFALGLLASPAAANECMGLWLERNAYFANKGYCFGSALGKGVFGNSGCHTKSPQMSSSETRRINQIKSRERALGCAAQKSRWSAAEVRAYARRITEGSRPAPAPQQRACSRQLELIFNISAQADIDPNLQVNGPRQVYVSTYPSSAYASANGNACVDGVYSYAYSVEYDDFFRENPRKRFTGSFRVGAHHRSCQIEITWHNGSTYVNCN